MKNFTQDILAHSLNPCMRDTTTMHLLAPALIFPKYVTEQRF